MSKIFQNKNILQKIAIVVLITILFYFTIPTISFAGWGGDMLKVLTQLLAALGDAVMGAFNHFMLGTDKMISSVMLSKDNPSITSTEGALYAGNSKVDLKLDQTNSEDNEERIDGGLWDEEDEWQVPNLLYSPEAIFSNNIAALDVNFLRPNKYSKVQDGTEKAQELSKSAAETLQETIGVWYVAFRNIAIVALLTVLVYLGIRILISSTSADKAKYKESLQDWLVAMCLVFVIHFIMSAILMLVDQVTVLFKGTTSGIVVQVGDDTPMKLSLMGVARLRVQSSNAGMSATFCIMYLVLVLYTIVFTVIYLKRFLYMAFLTMIAPLVAITYPIDKLGDGKAQAFNYWFKEYLMNAMLQPIHLILYTTLIAAAQDLATKNFIYSLVAIGFLIPAEKFIKEMFGFNKAKSSGTLGGFPAAALAMTGLNKLAAAKPPHAPNENGNGNKIRTADKDSEAALTGSSNYGGLSDINFNEQNPDNGADLNQDSQSGNSRLLNAANQGEPIMREHEENLRNYGDDLEDIAREGPIMNDRDGIPEPEITNRDRLRNAAQKIGGGARKVANTARQAADTPIGRTVIRGAKSIGKKAFTGKNIARFAGGAGKAILKTGTTAVGAGIGLAAGIATGDMSKAFSYTATGAFAGNKIGNNAANAVGSIGTSAGKAVWNTAGNIRNAYREEKYGLEEADKMRQEKINKKAMKEFMRNEDELAEAKKTQVKLAKQGNKNVKIEDIMKSRYDYISAGVKDNYEIRNAQLAEYKQGGNSHDNYVNIAKAANGLGIQSSTFSDKKKYNEFHDTISSSLGGEENGAKAMAMIAEIKGKDAIAANRLQSRNRRSQRSSN